LFEAAGLLVTTFDYHGRKTLILDSTTFHKEVTVGATTRTESSSIADASQSKTTTTVDRVPIAANQIVIAGEGFTYIVEDSQVNPAVGIIGAIASDHPRTAPARPAFRFVVGAEVKYSQQKSRLLVIDADGKQCKLPIVRQEVRQP
jgi:hypothetical protein